MAPVFIIGGSRTGSELLKRILRRYTSIDMVPEMFLLCPKWLHRDFARDVKKYAGGFGSDCDLDALIELMYSKQLYGTFWAAIEEIDKELLKNRLEATDRSLKGIFSALMEVHAELNNKTVPGAKFPLHYSYVELLINWYPDCKIIHTTRDPRAVYSSQAGKYTHREYSAPRNAWIRIKQFAHINIQSIWTSRIHEKLAGRSNYLLSRYEDLVTDPRGHLERICCFLDVEFQEEMATPQVFSNSSFDERRGMGGAFHKEALCKWKTSISPLTATTMSYINARAMRRFGYSKLEM